MEWFWVAAFANGTSMTFYGQNKGLAQDHATLVARKAQTTVKSVKRLKSAAQVTDAENAASGDFFPSDLVDEYVTR